MLRVLDLFAGIGGFSLGLESVGYEVAGHCEIDPFCQAVLRHHWPDVPLFGDVREVTGNAVEEACGAIDVVVGGPPCQPASVAGRRQGSSDVRWLWPEFLRVCREVRPRWVVAENPLGLVSLQPQGLDWVCCELEAAGYDVWPVVVGAEHVGAPHRRHRVWIVAHGPSGGQRVGGGARQPGDCGDADGCSAADGRGERPVGDAEHSGLRAGGQCEASDADDAGAAMGESAGGGLAGPGRSDTGPLAAAPALRWPARPGEPQWEWEEPRLAYGSREHQRGSWEGSARPEVAAGGHGPRGAGDARCPELPLGVAAHGLPPRLVRRANRESLKALGNAIVPQVAAVIGRAILAAEAEMTR